MFRALFILFILLNLSSCSQFGEHLLSDRDEAISSGHLMAHAQRQDINPEFLEGSPQESLNLIPHPNLYPQEPRLSIKAANSPVRNLLFNLAEAVGYQIDIWPDVTGQVTLSATNQTLEAILLRIADQLNLNITSSSNLITVKQSIPEWDTYLVDYVNIKRSAEDTIVMNMTVGGSSLTSNQGVGSKSEIKVSSSHNFWTSLENNLLAILGSSRELVTTSNLIVNSESGLVMVKADRQKQRQIKNFLDNLIARSAKQVMIEASVVEVELSDEYQSGIDWSNDGFKNIVNRNLILSHPDSIPLADNVFTPKLTSKVGLDLSLGLKMLETFGSVKVLSSPKIMAVNNQNALLKVVDNQVYFTIDVSRSTSTAGTDTTYSTTVHSVPVGFMMSVTPFVSDNREVSLNVRPTISRIIGYVTDPNPDLKAEMVESLVPIVQEREMETVLKLQDMQTAVIGGLIEDRQASGSTGITGLSRLPIIGKSLFGYKEESIKKTELVIFIRPVIVDNPDINNGDLKHYYSLLKHRTSEFSYEN